MTSTTVFIPGLPVPQPRARAGRIGSHARIYTPSNADQWKARVAHEVRAAGALATEGPVEVGLRFYFSRPASHFGTGRNAERLKPGAPPYPTTKGDVDNLAKAVLDALRGIAWVDDSWVVRLDVSKRWTLVPGREEEQEGVRLTIRIPEPSWVQVALASGLGCGGEGT